MSGHPLIAMAAAMKAAAETAKQKVSPTPLPFHAGMESKCRRATAYLDEKRAFYWEPGGFVTAYMTETSEYFELGWRAEHARDTWKDIDLRLAEAHWVSSTFADYIGA